MQYALRLAERRLGRTAPNPSVGCVIVQHGHIVGVGATGPGGRPHAETQALAMAGERARGATVYVTLEPCAHHGKTPPCAEALIEAGIIQAAIACRDPDRRVSGQGIALLQRAGVAVMESVCGDEAWALNEGFFRSVVEQRPLITLKVATSLDGYIATPAGQSQWITGAAARQHGHGLRATHDAILTGIGTVLADNPLLTCRLPGMKEFSPVRIVLDRQLRLSADSKLAQSAREWPLWVATAPELISSPAAKKLIDLGTQLLPIEPELQQQFSGNDLSKLLTLLASKGITRLLVEGGQQVTTSFLASGLVDHMYWYHAPFAIGEGGKAAIGALAGDLLADLPRGRWLERISLGEDSCDLYRLNPCLPALSPT